MPERTEHEVWICATVEAYDQTHAIDIVRAEVEVGNRLGWPLNDMTTTNYTGREERVEMCGTVYYKAKPHEADDVDALRTLQAAWIMGASDVPDKAARANLRNAMADYYRYVTGNSIDPRPRF